MIGARQSEDSIMEGKATENGAGGASVGDAANWLPAASRAVGRSIRAGTVPYRRERQLPRLIAADPGSLDDRSVAGAQAILSRLRRALRAERRRAKAGHWSYDLNRHIALRQAYAAEAERLARIEADATFA
jgi:hypothetical protein